MNSILFCCCSIFILLIVVISKPANASCSHFEWSSNEIGNKHCQHLREASSTFRPMLFSGNLVDHCWKMNKSICEKHRVVTSVLKVFQKIGTNCDKMMEFWNLFKKDLEFFESFCLVVLR